jgi:hypothetical protein
MLGPLAKALPTGCRSAAGAHLRYRQAQWHVLYLGLLFLRFASVADIRAHICHDRFFCRLPTSPILFAGGGFKGEGRVEKVVHVHRDLLPRVQLSRRKVCLTSY